MFDGLSGDIRVLRLRGKKPDCVVCGKEPKVTSLQDYQEFCGASATDKVILQRSLFLIMGTLCIFQGIVQLQGINVMTSRCHR